MSSATQIVVLDAGGQYCHLIARKVRDLGVFAEVLPSETPASALASTDVKGVIISGGPSSVYDPGSPAIALSMMSFFSASGLLYGYLWTRYQQALEPPNAAPGTPAAANSAEETIRDRAA